MYLIKSCQVEQPPKEKWFVTMFAILAISMSSCVYDEQPDTVSLFNVDNVTGYKPVYVSDGKNGSISWEAPRKIINPGKIAITGNYLLVNEKENGLHVINNANPSNPEKIAFIKIPGNVDIAIRDNFIYADSYEDLVTIEVGDSTATEVDRDREVFGSRNYDINKIPPKDGFYFECVDESKGEVAYWELTRLTEPKCYR